jgi:hypothetical protein
MDDNKIPTLPKVWSRLRTDPSEISINNLQALRPI